MEKLKLQKELLSGWLWVCLYAVHVSYVSECVMPLRVTAFKHTPPCLLNMNCDRSIESEHAHPAPGHQGPPCIAATRGMWHFRSASIF